MQFSKLDIRTKKSRLQNYFSMHYDEFDDMAEFIEKVRMEGRFENAEIG
jgi:predicted transport protein